MPASFPVGWFDSGVLWWGDRLGPRMRAARGGLLEIQDLRSADAKTLVDLDRSSLLLLASLGSDTALQITWTVEGDYGETLDRYAAQGGGSRWCRYARAVRGRYYRERAIERSLRRERLYVYLGRRCAEAGRASSSARATEAYLRHVASEFELEMGGIGCLFGGSRWALFGDQEHCIHLRKTLNPSLASGPLARAGEAALGFDRERSVRANCLRSEMNVFSEKDAEGRQDLLSFDGYLHGLFVMRSLPQGTRPGMLLPLLGSVSEGISLTVSVYPLSVDSEIERLRKEIRDLSLFLSDRKAIGVENEILARRARIDSLMSSVTIPFNMLFVVRVWDETLEGLSAKLVAVKTALHRLDGAAFFQPTNPIQASSLFHETLPGHLGSAYRGWDLYVENRNLAALLPVSASFGAHLDDAQALYDSPSGSLVGVRLLAGGQPQHTLVAGVNGSGKSAFLADLVSQTDGLWAYRFIQEEGLSFGTLSSLCGMESLVLRESGDRTINPFDTFGLPLTSSSISSAVRICMKLVGLSSDVDRNRRREALLAEYVQLHFDDCLEDWKNADEERWHALSREAHAAYLARGSSDDGLDACLAFRALAEGDRAARMRAIREPAQVRFSASREGNSWIRSYAFSGFGPADYPQFSGLVSLVRHARQRHHRGGAVGDELDFLASELAKGRRIGGLIGSFIDGETNLALRGNGLHFDTSFVPDGLLKELAGFVVFDRVRQYVISLPRAQPKLMLLDELRRVLTIPGAREFVKEALAQMRKFQCVFIGAFQEISQIDDIDPALSDLLLGQCKQFFLLRQNNRDQVARIGRTIGLPRVAERSIALHPLIEHQRGKAKASQMTYFSRESELAVCGTIRIELDPAMRYVAESSGTTFDDRVRALSRYPSPYEGVIAESRRREDGA